MNLSILDAKAAREQLKRMMSLHDKIFIAVAWGYSGDVADELLRYSKKFGSVTFGLSFCQTDAALINRLVGVKNAYVADDNGATFHPKIYYFETADKAEVVLGSSNFTAGGLSKNWEASIHAAGKASDQFFKDIRECLASYDSLRRPITADLAKAYQLQFEAAKKFKRPKNPVLPSKEAPWLNSNLVNMTWDQFARQVRKSRSHNVNDRLAMLRECQRMFASAKSFDDLTVFQWKAIAGVIGRREKKDAGLDTFDWGWFGSMAGMGDFNNRVKLKDPWLSDAVDSIPPHGDVTHADFTAYCKSFVRAFDGSTRIGGVPTATRLLAMKRPDVFVCVSNPNTEGLSKALSSSKAGIRKDFESYWGAVIEPVRQSSWYNAPRSTTKDADLWDRRVAMLDAIYYRV
ncbi:phospholipase D family protein [Neorhizobium galegae]|uniref:phospholipase D family protein n=1 Tax=Neorhizobium galegae TaxID=399 RepID=UPI00062259A0|nr:phospholipase D family protein [Neorhizobium galegae]CDZ55423.1 N-HKD family nuclease fused to DNA/RNA [Neorhizobium galegae bv. orientalis]